MNTIITQHQPISFVYIQSLLTVSVPLVLAGSGIPLWTFAGSKVLLIVPQVTQLMTWCVISLIFSAIQQNGSKRRAVLSFHSICVLASLLMWTIVIYRMICWTVWCQGVPMMSLMESKGALSHYAGMCVGAYSSVLLSTLVVVMLTAEVCCLLRKYLH